jgi:hypothetical protein
MTRKRRYLLLHLTITGDERMRAVQGGLFRAEYSGEINPESSDARDILDYHVSTSAEDAKIYGSSKWPACLGAGHRIVVGPFPRLR